MPTKLLPLLLLLIASTSFAGEYATSPAWVNIENAKVLANIPGQKQTAAYMTITNLSDKTLHLKNVHSDAAKTIELHEHAKVDGMMRMRKAAPLKLEAGKSATLKSGGLHLMLLDLTAGLTVGKTVELKLCFDQGCVISTADIVDVRQQQKQIHHHHHH